MSLEKYKFEVGEFQLDLDSHGNLYQLRSPYTPNEGLFQIGNERTPYLYWFLNIDGKEFHQTDLIFTPPVLTDHIVIIRGDHPQVTIDLSIIIDSIGPNWLMSITNYGLRKITDVGFALKGPFTFGHTLHCTFPYCAGWALPISDIPPEEQYILNYPVNASMQWTSIYTDDLGIYFGVHDSIPLYKDLLLENLSATWKFPDIDLNPGERLELPAVYLVPHGNSWRGGAECYRTWAQHHVKAPIPPDWYAKKPTWAWVGLKGQHQETVWHQSTYLPLISAFVAEAGVDLIQLTAYTEQGHDTLYPDYMPGESVGGQIGLRQAVDAIHQSGQRISIYTNGRVIDPASSVSQKDRLDWGVRISQNSDVFREQYGDVVFDVMCPGASGWRNLLIEKLEYLVKTFDIDGIYIDQISGCRSLPCYASNHDHKKPNIAWSYYRQFMIEIRERLISIKPDIFFATEGVNDLLGQYFDSQQAHNDWRTLTRNRGIPLADLYRTTFPGQLLNVGCITHEQSGEYYLKLAHVSGGGCDFGVWDWEKLPRRFMDKVTGIVNWHTENADVLRFGIISPLLDDINAHDWKYNAFYESSKIVLNGSRLGESVEAQSTQYHTISVPIPAGSIISKARVMGGMGTIPCKWSIQGDSLNVHLECGSGEMAGVAFELNKKNDS